MPDMLNIIDAHAHIYPAKIAARAVEAIGAFYDLPMFGQGTEEDLEAWGAKAGMHRFLVSSSASDVRQVTAINDFIAAACARHPNFIGFGTMHPDFPQPEKEIERMISLRLRGVKIHSDCQGINMDAPGFMPIYEMLEGTLPVLFHVGDRRMDFSSPVRLAGILKRFPRLTAIAAHLGGYSVWEEAAHVLLGQNVYLDTSSSLMFLEKEKAVSLIRRHGTDRVLFGTDYPMWTHQEELRRFMALGLTEEENRQILSGNAERLLGIERQIAADE